MKPITQYNFREIVGQFVKVKIENLKPDYQYYVGYCYIDMQFGMSIRVYGSITDAGVKKLIDGIITVRCTENMEIENFNDATEDMYEMAANINELYIPDWIISARNHEAFDPYRNRIYVDDLLIPIGTYNGDQILFESLWVRPSAIYNDILYGRTIEKGKLIDENVEVAIMDRSNLGKLFEEISSVVGIDPYLAKFLEESIPKEETNEVQEETT